MRDAQSLGRDLQAKDGAAPSLGCRLMAPLTMACGAAYTTPNHANIPQERESKRMNVLREFDE